MESELAGPPQFDKDLDASDEEGTSHRVSSKGGGRVSSKVEDLLLNKAKPGALIDLEKIEQLILGGKRSTIVEEQTESRLDHSSNSDEEDDYSHHL